MKSYQEKLLNDRQRDRQTTVISQDLLQDPTRNRRVAAYTCNAVTLEAELLNGAIRYQLTVTVTLLSTIK